MPLVATVDGVRVESVFVDAERWQQIREMKGKTVMSCGSSGHPRTSTLGMPFFAHNPGSHCGLHPGGESEVHLRTKAIIAKVARECGYTATLEHPAEDRSWIADVLIEKDGVRTAVEAQWSPQSEADFRYRTDRYRAAGLDTIWLAGPKALPYAQTSPHFAVDDGGVSGAAITVRISEPIRAEKPLTFDLEAGLRHILNSPVLDHVEAVADHLVVETAMTKCWLKTCEKWMTAWFVSGIRFETRCGITSTISIRYTPHLPDRFERLVEAEVRVLGARSGLPSLTKFATRNSHTAEKAYMGQTCPHCRTLQGDVPLMIKRGHAFEPWLVTGQRRLPIDFTGTDTTHRCSDIGRGLCQMHPASTAGFGTGSSDPDGHGMYFGGDHDFEQELGRDKRQRRRW